MGHYEWVKENKLTHGELEKLAPGDIIYCELISDIRGAVWRGKITIERKEGRKLFYGNDENHINLDNPEIDTHGGYRQLFYHCHKEAHYCIESPEQMLKQILHALSFVENEGWGVWESLDHHEVIKQIYDPRDIGEYKNNSCEAVLTVTELNRKSTYILKIEATTESLEEEA